MRLSYIIITYNRRDVLLKHLEQVYRNTPLPSGQWETWVVDNASTDASAEAVAQAFPQVHLIRLAEEYRHAGAEPGDWPCAGAVTWCCWMTTAIR